MRLKEGLELLLGVTTGGRGTFHYASFIESAGYQKLMRVTRVPNPCPILEAADKYYFSCRDDAKAVALRSKEYLDVLADWVANKLNE